MILKFIFSNLNAIIFSIWFLLLVVVALRLFKPAWVKNISYSKLIFIAIGLVVFYGLFITWGQYYVWLKSSDFTRALVTLPLPDGVPFPSYLEWTRVFFAGNHGYFIFYVFGRIWLNIIISLAISGFLYFLFRVWSHYKGSFMENGPELILVLTLISGFPNVLVTVVLGFVISIFLFAFKYFKGDRDVKIEPAFVVAAFLSLFFANVILSYVL